MESERKLLPRFILWGLEGHFKDFSFLMEWEVIAIGGFVHDHLVFGLRLGGSGGKYGSSEIEGRCNNLGQK